MRDGARLERRALVLAADDRDAAFVANAASEAGFPSERVETMAQLCAAIDEGAGSAAIVDAKFTPAELVALGEALRRQPPWSDLPILVVFDVGADEALARFLAMAEKLQQSRHMAYLTPRRLLEHWPLYPAWFRVAFEARRRQYAVRDLMKALDVETRSNLAMLAALPVGILVTDGSGRVVKTNAAFERIWGGAIPIPRSTEELRLFRGSPAGAPRTSPPFEWRIPRVLATGETSSEEELDIEAFDGARRTILSSVVPIRVAEGEVAGAVVLQVDITERARAARARQILQVVTAALIESLDLDATLRTVSRTVVTHLADCCVIDEVDEHGGFRRLVAESSGERSAEEAARLLAFAPTATGNSLAARVLSSGKPVLLSDVPSDWLATGLEADEHRAAFAKAGVYSIMVLPLIARGRQLGVLGIMSTRRERRYDARDLALAEEISRRAALALDNARLHAQACDALRARDEALAELDAFLNASPVGFVVLDRDLRFRRINPVYSRWHQKAPEEILGRTHEEVVSPEVASQAVPRIRAVLRTGEALTEQELVGEAPRGSGRKQHQFNSFFPVLDVDGSPRGVGIAITDVTRLKEAEDALRDEARFRERFIGVLAHDLRNPLNAIVMSAGTLLRQGDAPPTWTRTLARIAHAAERMERMIGNLLDLARSREGRGIQITPAATDVGHVVREVVDELEASHPGRAIGVAVEGETCAEVDADRIAEVVSNLVGNALAYSPRESAVEVRITGRDDELALAVHNEGIPISPESRKTIFLPFQRGAHEAAGAAPMRGFGLGLFIVGEIARAHGGSVDVSSTAEEGTTFTVRLPRMRAAAGVEQHARP